MKRQFSFNLFLGLYFRIFLTLSPALFLTLALSIGATLSRAADRVLPVPQIETLKNGLQIAWFLNNHLPVTDLLLLVKTGYRDDPAGKSGTAELLSSVLSRGAAGLSAQEIARRVEMLGASQSYAAGDDHFTIAFHGLSPDAPALLDVMAKVAMQPDFISTEVEREKARILDRWKHLGDSGESLAGVLFSRLISKGSEYFRGGFYSSREFQKVNRDEVVDFYKQHFVPENSILVVVGRVNQEEFKKEVEKTFGTWSHPLSPEQELELRKKQHKAPRQDTRLKKASAQTVHLIVRPELTQAQVRIGFQAPLLNSPDHYPLVVANTLLGEYFSSRLNSVIRDKLGLTYSIGSGFSYNKTLASFTIGSATQNQTVGQLISKTVEILNQLKKGPITKEEVQMAKDYLTGGFPLSVSTLGSVAARWLNGYVFELGPGYLNDFNPKIREVTREQVQAAVIKHFDLAHLVIVVAGDGPSVKKSLTESKIPYVTYGLGDLR